jgi:hypothetical protein
MLRRYLNVLVLFINEFYEYGQNSLRTDFNKIIIDDISCTNGINCAYI